MTAFPYRRILIVGNGGAGKSTLARKIGKKFALPVVHLDQLWWLPDWVNRSREEFDELLAAELEKPAWVMDGNFRRTFPERLRRADLCIFLDLPAEICLKSAYARAEQYRGKTRPDMTEGCLERIDPEFEIWIKEFERNVRPEILALLERSGVPYRIFTAREEAENWLKSYHE